MSKILLYAELLLNIRQVTLFVTLPSTADRDTTIRLSPDCRSISVTHQGTKLDLELPCQVAPSAALSSPLLFKARELSFRLQVAGDLDQFQNVRSTLASPDTPWPASSLTPETRISCRSCENFLAKECISIWKDLPSENWAEMMDFWHCHKPDAEETHNDRTHGLTKGYAASNGLAPSPGVGLVDISHIILLESDCLGLQVCMSSTLTSSHRPEDTLALPCLAALKGIKKGACFRHRVGFVARSPIQMPHINFIVHYLLEPSKSSTPHMWMGSWLL